MCKRVMIAGTGSGCGKTTVTCALLAALVSLGKDVISFKCGPDYIDPMFHKKAAGVQSRNLDVFLMGEKCVKRSLARHCANRDIAVLEGAMGLYDGLGGGSFASGNHVCVLTNTPAVLIVNAKGAALSVCATIKGFLELEKNNIRGVILNNVSDVMFGFYKRMIEERLDVCVIGFMPRIPEAQIESRHLGLVTADEITGIKEKINVLKKYALECIDITALLDIAGQAWPFCYQRDFHFPAKQDGVILYIACDEAFSFWYEDNHDLLKSMGAEIRFFSPIHDRRLPDDAAGLVLWGGYPELYAKELEENKAMRESLKSALDAGLPVYAECGGFMYLQQTLTDLQGRKYEMLGVLPGNVKMTSRLQNFGYYEIEAQRDNLLCAKGGKINAHFFRYSVSDCEGDCFNAVKQNGKSFPCVVSQKNIFAGYQHLHFEGNPGLAENFINACIEYKAGANSVKEHRKERFFMNFIMAPAEIEKRSFEIIQENLDRKSGGVQLDPQNINVIKRVIHTTADFDYADNLFFSNDAVNIAKNALKNGARIVTDTQMAKAGINKKAAVRFGCGIHCFIDAPKTAETAQTNGFTRAYSAVDIARETLENPIIFAVGNAPTALIRLYELITGNVFSPVLIIAAPVGFVNVTESKELILGLEVPHIAAKGQKGGSNVAAAICNALLYEAAQ